MFDYSGQVSFVTGGSRGIGRKIAEGFAAGGAKVAVADIDEAEAEVCAQSLRDAGTEAISLRLDVSDPEAAQAGVKKVVEHFGQIDILVNNAGITRDKLLLRMGIDDWRKVLSVNLDGVYYVTRQVVPVMMKKRFGRIINIASVVAHIGNPGQANYVASKAGVIGFTKTLAREVASRNITVNAVAPGFIDTAMTAVLTEETKENLLSSVPLRRMGTAEDIAVGVRFLASKEAGYITGHVLNINGGMYM